MAAKRSAETMTNADAALSSVAAMRTAGRLEPVDDALVAAVMNLARAVDLEPTDSRLWGQYQTAVKALRDVGRDEGDDDEIGRLLASIRSPTPVGNPADGPADTGRRGRKTR